MGPVTRDYLIGPVTKDYLRHFRLAPTQCAVNVFRILDYVDALNENMGLRLTHNVNWCYNLQHLKCKSYYMKARDDKVLLIQCLPESSNGRPSLSNRGGGTRWGIQSRRGLIFCVIIVCTVWLLM